MGERRRAPPAQLARTRAHGRLAANAAFPRVEPAFWADPRRGALVHDCSSAAQPWVHASHGLQRAVTARQIAQQRLSARRARDDRAAQRPATSRNAATCSAVVGSDAAPGQTRSCTVCSRRPELSGTRDANTHMSAATGGWAALSTRLYVEDTSFRATQESVVVMGSPAVRGRRYARRACEAQHMCGPACC